MSTVKSQIIEQVAQLVEPVLRDNKVELVDLQWVHEHGQWVLRFFLDKSGGITLDDCALLSDRIGGQLDAANVIPQSYSLEVSSPGVYRPLKKVQDFDRFKGEKVDVTLFAPLNGRRHFKGTLVGFANGAVAVTDSNGETFQLPHSDIAKAHLDPDIEI